MASNSTVSVTFKLQTDGAEVTLQDMAKGIGKLREGIEATVQPAEQLQTRLINFNQISRAFDNITKSVDAINVQLQDLSAAYQVQETAERQLETAMRNTMGATDDEIQSIKDLASAQQQLGVIGDEVQLQGAQELATYLELTSSLETLIPVMNDMVAQQYGLGASGEAAASIATMLGKVMNGQTSALSRYGYTFDEAQEKILKFGTESERAAVLAEVVGQSVGGMNAALAQTDSGRAQQLANALGDVKEQLGGMVKNVAPYVALTSQILASVNAMASLRASVMALVPSLARTANEVNILGYSIRTTTAATRALALSLKALVVGTGIFAAFAVVSHVMSTLVGNMNDTAQAAEKATGAARSLADATQEGAVKASEQRIKIERLLNVMNDETQAMTARIDAQKQLNGAIDGFNAKLDDTGKKFIYNKQQLDKYIESLSLMYQMEGAKSLLTDIGTRRAEIAVQRADAQEKAKLAASEPGRAEQAATTSGTATATRQVAVNLANASLMMLDDEERKLKAKEEQVLDYIKNKNIELANVGSVAEDDSSGGRGSGASETTTADKTRYEELRDLIADTTDRVETMTKTEQEAARRNVAAWTEELNAIELRRATLTRPDALETMADYDAEISYQSKLLRTARGDEAAAIQANIDKLHDERTALTEVTATLPKQITNYEELDQAVKFYTDRLRTADARHRAYLTAIIKSLREVRDEWEDAANGVAAPDETATALANRVKDLTSPFDTKGGVYEVRAVGLDEAASRITEINRLIENFGDKLTDTQRNALKDAARQYAALGKTATNSLASISRGWQGLKGVGNGVRSMTEALSGNHDVWETITGAVDGALTVMSGISAIVSLVQSLAAITKAASAATAATSAAEVVAATKETAAYSALAAAKTFAAHASIPFAGTEIAAEAVTQQQVMITAAGIPKFADGGIVYGPTLALTGEYAGAATNPEVIAPLDKLRTIIHEETGAESSSGTAPGVVQLKVSGTDLVGVLANVTRIQSRSGKRTNIKI